MHFHLNSLFSRLFPLNNMSRRSLFFLILLVALLLGFSFSLGYCDREERNFFIWDENSRDAYAPDNDQPYGAQVLYRLLDDYFPGKDFKKIDKDFLETLPENPSAPATYVFIGNGIFLDSLSTDRLLKFVKNGNTALLISRSVPFDLMNMIYFEECDGAIWDEYAGVQDSFFQLQLNEPKLSEPVRFFASQQNKVYAYNTLYLPAAFFCEELPQRSLGYINNNPELTNFSEFPCGKGKFLLHTTPMVFSNFHLLRPEMRHYAQAALSHLPESNIYWDNMSRVPESVTRRRNNADSAQDPDKDHLLTYVLQQPALAWSWYLLLGLTAVWLIFRAKRRQRVIPVLPRNENSSYEFINTIANLHFRERNYAGQSRQSMRLFLAQVRDRYGVTFHIDPDTELPKADPQLIQRLSMMSEVPENDIYELFKLHATTVNFIPVEADMVGLHLAIEKFFSKAK